MTRITTTTDYLTWHVNLSLHTEEEVQEYISDLDINHTAESPDEVRCIVVQTVDKVITINGIAFQAPLFRDGITRYTQAIGAYSSINGNRVKAIHYYPDKDSVMVEYLPNHPTEIRTKNTYHTISDFGTFFEDLFLVWKQAMLDILAGTLVSVEAEITSSAVQPTGE